MIRKKLTHFWFTLTIGVLVLWLLCYAYDQLRGRADGLIGNWVYNAMFTLFLAFNSVGFLLSLGLTARKKIVRNLSLSVLSGLIFLLLLEGIGHLAIAWYGLEGVPIVFRRFYITPEVPFLKPFPAGDLNPVTGRGHVPNSTYAFVNCRGDSIRWLYNAAGANDRPRSITNAKAKKRIAVIGDSFMEGYMVNNADRCSNLLEQKTGLEHLNFAVNGSNPLNYYLTCKTIVKAYDADVLVVGFLPANDFEMRNDQSAYTLVDWPVYVPYWQGVYPAYTLRYTLANVNQSIFYGYHTQASLLRVVDSVYSSLPWPGKLKADFLAHSSIFQLLGELKAKNYREGRLTKYQEFTDEEWNYVRYSLTKLISEAKSQKVILLSIPTLWDLKALKNGKINRIDSLLANLCRQQGAAFIPLSPSLLAYEGEVAQLYVSCDGHWSVRGEAFVADVIYHHPAYRASVGLF